MPDKKPINRDYPLAATPEPKVYLSAEGIGSNKNYNVNASLQVPVYKGVRVGVERSFSKDQYGTHSSDYRATLRVPLGKNKK